MARPWSILAWFLFASSAASTATSFGDLLEHEVAGHLPKSWTYVRDPYVSDKVNLRFAIKTEPAVPEAEILNRTDPDSALYGHYLTATALKEARKSSRNGSSSALVGDWLKAHQIHTYQVKDEHINVQMSAHKANKILNADFLYYTRAGQKPVLRTTRYSLPQALQDHVDFVYPTVHFWDFQHGKSHGKMQRRQQGQPAATPSCAGNICPETLVDRYNIDYAPADNKSHSKLAIASFLEQYPSTQDNAAFQAQFGLKDRVAAPFKVETLKGGLNPNTTQSAGTEAMLDIEYTTVLTGPLDVTFYSTAGRAPTLNSFGNVSVPTSESSNEPFLDFFDDLLRMEAPPQVITMSYGDNEQTVPAKYAQKVCYQMSLLAARGVTVITSSGDGGVQGTISGLCIGPDGEERFVPTFPSSCSWVTSVGATAQDGSVARFSSGGFSNLFPRPKWQDKAVEGYIQQLNGTHDGLYNTSGRGIPDVAVVGEDYLTVVHNKTVPANGSSASAPVFAAMVTLLNDIRLRAGKPALGFLNPTLYSERLASAFTDVTHGSNVGCLSSNGQGQGFPALSGWDAASGLGEPDFAKLRSLTC